MPPKQYLFTQRRALIKPHRLLEAVDHALRELRDLFDAVGATLDPDAANSLWCEAAKRLAAARDKIIEPNELAKRLHQLEAARAAIEAAVPKLQAVLPKWKLPFRKGMRFAGWPHEREPEKLPAPMPRTRHERWWRRVEAKNEK